MDSVIGYLRKIDNDSDGMIFIYPTLIIENDKIREISVEERNIKFPNRGTIYVPTFKIEEFTPYLESGLVKVFIDDNNLSARYDENDSNSCKYQVLEPERLNAKELIEVIDVNKSIEEIINDPERRIDLNYKPLNDKIILQIDNYLYGPLEFISSKTDEMTYQLKLTANQLNGYRINQYNIEGFKDSIRWSKTNYSSEEQRAFIYKIDELYKPESSIDFIEDNRLINILKDVLSDYNEIKLTNNTIRQMKKVISEKNLVGEILTPERVKRLSQYELLTQELLNFKQHIMEEYLVSENGKGFKEEYVKEHYKELREHDEFKELEDEFNKLNIQITEARKVIEELEKDKQIKEAKVKEEIVNTKKGEIISLEKKLQSLNIEIESKQRDLETIREKYQLNIDYIQLREEVKQLENENFNYSKSKERKEEEIRRLDGNITKKIEEITTTAENLDLFNKFNRQANIIKNNIKIEKKKTSISLETNLTADEIIDKIYNDFEKINRELSRESIINYLITITQNFITIFSGEPGTGKTSFTRLLAKSLGLYQERYLHIPVSRGWTSQRDLIGYYNPLTEQIEKSETGLYDLLKKTSDEYENKIYDRPTMIVLDEANLSPVEHYWSTFMSVYENIGEKSIQLGPNEKIHVCDSIRFLATINNDHTTEQLSPRFLDRAAVILMERTDVFSFDEGFSDESLLPNNEKVISQDLLSKYFNAPIDKKDYVLNSRLKGLLEKIYEECNSNETAQLTISYRTNNAISKYCIVAENYFQDDKKDLIMDYAIAQYLLPTIYGYGDGYKQLLLKLKNIFINNGLKHSFNIIDRIIRHGEEEHGYFTFFG